MTITAGDSVANDEEIARALQERFEEEEEAAAAARATRDARDAMAPSDAAVARRLVDEELRAAEAFETSMYSGSGDDAFIAQRMEQERNSLNPALSHMASHSSSLVPSRIFLLLIADMALVAIPMDILMIVIHADTIITGEVAGAAVEDTVPVARVAGMVTPLIFSGIWFTLA